MLTGEGEQMVRVRCAGGGERRRQVDVWDPGYCSTQAA